MWDGATVFCCVGVGATGGVSDVGCAKVLCGVVGSATNVCSDGYCATVVFGVWVGPLPKTIKAIRMVKSANQ